MLYYTILSAFIIGLILGLTGGGGSILTVPVLVYLIGLDPLIAITYSLFVVGATALTGAFNYAIKKLIDFTAAFYFAIPSMVSIYVMRKWVVKMIPSQVHFFGFCSNKTTALMVIFSVLIFIIGFSMVRKKNETVTTKNPLVGFNYFFISLQGLIVGMITGLLGAGGGFIIVPSLVLLGNIPIRVAIGTSLLIIAINSIFGFVADAKNSIIIDWHFLMIFASAAIAGVLSGTYYSKKISPPYLKKGFGYFLLATSAYIFAQEVFLK